MHKAEQHIFKNQHKCIIQSGALVSQGGTGLLCADKQHGLMVQDPAQTIFSKYTVGSSASKIQYVSTWRAMSPNDLYMVGLVWLWTKPSLWETNGMRERDRERGGHIYSFEKWDQPTGTCWQTWDPGDFGISLTGDGETGYPIGLKSSYEDNLSFVVLLKQERENTEGRITDCIHYIVHPFN